MKNRYGIRRRILACVKGVPVLLGWAMSGIVMTISSLTLIPASTILCMISVVQQLIYRYRYGEDVADVDDCRDYSDETSEKYGEAAKRIMKSELLWMFGLNKK